MDFNTVPFRGIRYNMEKLGRIERLVAPPYDVISPEQRAGFCARHPCNIVHLTLGKDACPDGDQTDPYTLAGRSYALWEQDGVLKEDPHPAYYVYDQEFSLGGVTFTRRAFFAAVKLEPFGNRILPHEETMPGPRADRLRLIDACPVNLSPVFGLYPDSDRQVASLFDSALGEPEASFVDSDGVRQTLWRIEDPQIARQLSQRMQDKPIYIADGHHRYETALMHRDHAAEAEGGLALADPRNYVMIACVSLSDPGLVVLPAHRVIGGMSDFTLSDTLEKLSGAFSIQPVQPGSGPLVAALLQRMKGNRHTFGFYSGGKAFMLTLKDDATADENPVPRSAGWKRLDVSLLVWLIFEQTLGFTHEDLSDPERVSYVKDEAKAAQLVDGGQFQMACYLNATGLGELEEVAQGGERMPPKSTYFYPKLLTGLVMRKLR